MIVKPVGIENVVNWQDNGIFADTQKPVTDDNYTLAGDVNQDNLYVGYMKEHGLKGKLSLPVLSSLGAITGRQTIGDCEVYKHVNGTTIIKGAVINPNLPDSRISLGFSADENGLQYYNNPNDPMPIKTINMAGLQKWEETDDYIIYVDKDAVMTTVQQYVTGTYDLFLERKANVDGAMELLKENGIEWTPEDDSKLLQDINLAQLERIASTPATMDEPTEIQAFEARTVPTTYECCFRTDKKSGEIYVGEGYENLVKNLNGFEQQNKFYDSNGYLTLSPKVDIISNLPWARTFFTTTTINYIKDGEKCIQTCEIINITNTKSYFQLKTFRPFNGVGDTLKNVGLGEGVVVDIRVVRDGGSEGGWLFGSGLMGDYAVGDEITIKWQITKTSTPKPFVRSVMPSGKLSFVTNATSDTHSFVMKAVTTHGAGVGTPPLSKVLMQNSMVYGAYERLQGVYDVVDYDVLHSNKYCNYGVVDANKYGVLGKLSVTPTTDNRHADTLKQLLIYKGNLTESELKAENEKEINIGAYYYQENSVPLTYGIDCMKSMRVYSSALTDIEIAEEVNKNIYIPENRDGVPNYLGEVK